MDAAPASLATQLAAAAWEAGQVARFGLELQDALAAPGADDVRPWQGLDLLVQHAQGLQTFLEALAAMCPTAWRVPAGAAGASLLLDAQRRRLALEPPQAEPLAGLCELF